MATAASSPTVLIGPDQYGLSPHSSSSAVPFSPAYLAVGGILVVAWLLVLHYYVFVLRCNCCCNLINRRRGVADDEEANMLQTRRVPLVWGSNPSGVEAGLDDAAIAAIPARKFGSVRKIEDLQNRVNINECAICLSSFREDEVLRLLPDCRHAFHVTCIDPCLRTRPQCPCCRSHVKSSNSDTHNCSCQAAPGACSQCGQPPPPAVATSSPPLRQGSTSIVADVRCFSFSHRPTSRQVAPIIHRSSSMGSLTSL